MQPLPVGPSTFEAIWEGRDAASAALITPKRTWSTAELRSEVERVACALLTRGLGAGDRVVWAPADDAASLISLLATVRAGGVWVGLSPRSTASERARVLELTGATAVNEALPDEDPSLTLPPPPPPDAVAAIAMTSGTTGRPKGVVHAQQQLLYPAAAAIATERLTHTTRIGTPLPLTTLNILLLGPVTALACGGTAVSMPSPEAEAFTSTVQAHTLTRTLVVPTIVHDLVVKRIDPARLRSLDRMLIGGAGFDRTRARAAQEHLGVPLVASYGLSEAPTGVARMRIGEAGATALPGIDIQVEPDGEITLAPTAHGPWANTWQGALGYLGEAGASSRLWRHGRLHTGDAGALDGDGHLLVAGRVSEMINRGGATIAPAEVEHVLLALDDVIDAAVFGVPDERLGQIVAGALVGPVDLDIVSAAVRAELSAYKVPTRWLVLDSLPRNEQGKVDRNELRRLLT